MREEHEGKKTKTEGFFYSCFFFFFLKIVKITTRNMLEKTSLWAGAPLNEEDMPQEGRRVILGVNSYF